MKEKENFLNYQKSADNTEGERTSSLLEDVIKAFENRGEDILMVRKIRKGITIVIHSVPDNDPRRTIVAESDARLNYREIKKLADQIEK